MSDVNATATGRGPYSFKAGNFNGTYQIWKEVGPGHWEKYCRTDLIGERGLEAAKNITAALNSRHKYLQKINENNEQERPIESNGSGL